jgi:hypothetical protein
MSSPEIYPVLVTEAVTLNTGGTTSATTAAIDTVVNGRKARRATFIIPVGTVAAGGGLSVCKVQDSSTSGGSYADITGAAITTIGDTDDDSIAVIDIDLVANGCDRFLDLVLTTAGAVNTDINAVVCLLSIFDVEPPYDAGLAAVARV